MLPTPTPSVPRSSEPPLKRRRLSSTPSVHPTKSLGDLRSESALRLISSWQAIADKYGDTLNDGDNDLINLRNLEVTTDNGFLRGIRRGRELGSFSSDGEADDIEEVDEDASDDDTDLLSDLPLPRLPAPADLSGYDDVAEFLAAEDSQSTRGHREKHEIDSDDELLLTGRSKTPVAPKHLPTPPSSNLDSDPFDFPPPSPTPTPSPVKRQPYAVDPKTPSPKKPIPQKAMLTPREKKIVEVVIEKPPQHKFATRTTPSPVKSTAKASDLSSSRKTSSPQKSNPPAPPKTSSLGNRKASSSKGSIVIEISDDEDSEDSDPLNICSSSPVKRLNTVSPTKGVGSVSPLKDKVSPPLRETDTDHPPESDGEDSDDPLAIRSSSPTKRHNSVSPTKLTKETFPRTYDQFSKMLKSNQLAVDSRVRIPDDYLEQSAFASTKRTDSLSPSKAGIKASTSATKETPSKIFPSPQKKVGTSTSTTGTVQSPKKSAVPSIKKPAISSPAKVPSPSTPTPSTSVHKLDTPPSSSLKRKTTSLASASTKSGTDLQSKQATVKKPKSRSTPYPQSPRGKGKERAVPSSRLDDCPRRDSSSVLDERRGGNELDTDDELPPPPPTPPRSRKRKRQPSPEGTRIYPAYDEHEDYQVPLRGSFSPSPPSSPTPRGRSARPRAYESDDAEDSCRRAGPSSKRAAVPRPATPRRVHAPSSSSYRRSSPLPSRHRSLSRPRAVVQTQPIRTQSRARSRSRVRDNPAFAPEKQAEVQKAFTDFMMMIGGLFSGGVGGSGRREGEDHGDEGYSESESEEELGYEDDYEYESPPLPPAPPTPPRGLGGGGRRSRSSRMEEEYHEDFLVDEDADEEDARRNRRPTTPILVNRSRSRGRRVSFRIEEVYGEDDPLRLRRRSPGRSRSREEERERRVDVRFGGANEEGAGGRGRQRVRSQTPGPPSSKRTTRSQSGSGPRSGGAVGGATRR